MPISIPENLEIDLENLTCDLLSLKKYQGFLEILFSVSRGSWISATECCAGIPSLPSTEASLCHRLDDLMVTWLDYPQSPDKDHSVVVFFLEELYWSKVAVFNRKTLVDQPSRKKKRAKIK